MSAERGTRQAENTVLICFAVKEEAAVFKKRMGDAPDVQVLITGMGEKNSERALWKVLKKTSPSFVLTCGFAGALNPELKIGDVVFDEDAGAELGETLTAAGARRAGFCCTERVATTAAEKAELRRSTQADAVEMESRAIRTICRKKKIPSATVRVISDAANEDLPLDFNALMTADQQLSFAKLAVTLMKSPGKIPRLMKLQRNTRFAAERIADVLQQLLRVRGARV